jgi:hypothetical protein
MTASTITWSGADTGQLWADPLNWVGGKAPGPGDTAVIVTDTNDPTIAQGTTAAIQNVMFDGGPGADLVVAGTLALGGTLTLGAGSVLLASGGEVLGGTIDPIGSEVSGGTLDGVTLIGTPTGLYPDAIVGGLTSLLATIDLSGVFVGNQTLTVETAVGGIDLDGVVTLAAGGTLENTNLVDSGSGAGTLVNDGVIVDTTTVTATAGLVNNDQMTLSGTYDQFVGVAVTNTGTLTLGGGGDVFFGPGTGTSLTNSGLLNIASGTLDVEQIPFDDTGGTITLGGAAELSLGATLQGGVVIGTGGTIGGGTNAGGTLEGVSLEGTLTIGDFTRQGITASGDTQFASQSPGVRASATLVTPLTFTGDATINDVDLTLVSFVPSGQLKGNGALTLGTASDIAFAGNANLTDAPSIVAATSLALGGTIEGFDGLLSLGAGSGGILNTGTIETVAGETLAIGTTGSFQNRGVLSLVAGSTLALTGNVAASALSGIAATAAAIVLSGTLSGDGTQAGSTATLPAGTIFSTEAESVLSHVTIDDEGSVGSLFGTLDDVTWVGVPLTIENTGYTYLTGGLTVQAEGGAPGTLVIAGTNSILNLRDSETLDYMTVDIGSTLAIPGNDSFTLLDGLNPTLGTDSNLTIGANATVNIVGDDTFDGINDIGTLTVAGTLQLGDASGTAPLAVFAGSGDTSATGSGGVGASSMHINGVVRDQIYDAFFTNVFGTMDPVNYEELIFFIYSGYTPYLPAQSILEPSSIHGSLSVRAQTASIPPTDITRQYLNDIESTLDGSGTIFLSSAGVFGLDAITSAGITMTFTTADAMLALANPTTMGGKITNFGVGDAIDLNLYGYTGGNVTYTDGELAIPTAGGDISLNVQFATGYSAADVQLADDTAGGTIAYIACFAEGTRIATACGPVPVEALRPGDRACVAGGGTRPIVWIGHRRIDCGRHPNPRHIWPVRVRAGAFGPGRPAADVRLSPDHAVFADGVLVPVRHLIDGRAIVQEPVAGIAYWHVELDRHDVILAEGLPCESFLDTGNRSSFADGPVVQMHADFSRRVWDADGCAPLVVAGPMLEQVRTQVCGYRSEATESAGTTRNRSAKSERATGSSSGSVKPGWAAAGTTST